MDAKVTKTRLNRMLAYDWLKIIGIALVFILVWTLIFTMTATRVISSQQFVVCNYTGNVMLGNEYNNHLYEAKNKNVFSYDLLEINTVDMTVDESVGYQLLEARTAIDELDMMFISKQNNPNTATTNEAGETVYGATYLQTFLSGYQFKLHNIDDYLSGMEKYLQSYYGDDWKTGTLDEKKVEENFRARVASAKDKRYKKEWEIVEGVKGEKDRLEKQRKALIDFNKYLADGWVAIETTTYLDENGEDILRGKGAYSINICPSTAPEKTSEKLSRMVGYVITQKDEETGAEKRIVTAKDMSVCLFNSNGDEEAYRYEGLIYLTNLIGSLQAE